MECTNGHRVPDGVTACGLCGAATFDGGSEFTGDTAEDPREASSFTQGRRRWLLVALAVVAVVATGGVAVATLGGGDDSETGLQTQTSEAERVAPPPTTALAETTTSTTSTTTTTQPEATTTAPVTTTAAAPTTAAPPPTTAPLEPFAGTVAVLDQVTFVGSIDGDPDYQLPPPGTPCSGRGGYADLAPGGTVIVTDASGTALATTALGGGVTQHAVRNTRAERQQREQLIDSIYDLRHARAHGDRVRQAELNLERAELRLHDMENPGPSPQAFEGRPFAATWCVLPFSTGPIPPTDVHTVTVTHRGSTTFTGGQSGVELIVG